ncbi:oligomeric, coiled-coil, peripheral membrane protein [Lobosporangium transversale]|nr:oligomeric, coiled-coil, peripheral membrane protein [Lobosporangium transversale]
MVYNREVLTTDIGNSISTLTEQPRSEPPVLDLSPAQLQPLDIPPRPESPSENREWSSQFQTNFDAYAANILAHYKAIVAHAKICDRIMEELRVQALAVQVALTNLDAHSRFPRDIDVLRQIKVHPALLPADSPERYISDFIPTEKLVQWAERCREIHEGLLRDGKDLSRSIKEVQEGTIAIRSNSGINLDQLEDAMADILQTLEHQSQIREWVVRDQSRVKEKLIEISRPSGFPASASTLEALVQLANVYVKDYMGSSKKADNMLRDKLTIFIAAKRSQTANLITQLMHISRLQSTIANIPPSLSNLDESLRKRDADFSQLVYVQRIPIAYGALLVEVVRRREYSKLLLQKSQQLAEVMSRFRQLEQRRRDSFRSDIAKFVPVVVPGLDDVPSFCEINALNTRDRLPSFTREHIAEFERLVNQLSIGLGGPDDSRMQGQGVEQSNVGISSISSGQDPNQDAFSRLRTTLTKMTAQVEAMGSEFDKILEKSFMTDRIMRLEEENARLRAEMSRIDVQQRSGTPQLAQQPFSRQNTPVGGVGGSIGQASTAISGTTIPNNPSSSPKLARKPSRGSSSTPIAHRGESDEQQQALQQQLQQNQRLIKENTELSTKIKAYETRIRSLEEKLYQHFHASSSVELPPSPKGSASQPGQSTDPDHPWKASENLHDTHDQLQPNEEGRKVEEERLRILEQELQDISLKLHETESKLRDECNVSRQALALQDELRQELLELKLQSATMEGASNEGKVADTIAQKRAGELDEGLKDMTHKYELLLQRQEKEKETHAMEIQTFKDRIQELNNQLSIDKEAWEKQLGQATERATELENELAVVNEELQNKVLQLEEELENHAAEHENITARAREQERQLESHRTVYNDIFVQLKEQEQKTSDAIRDGQKAKDDYAKLHETQLTLEREHEALTKAHTATQKAKDDLAEQTEILRKQISELETQREVYKADVNLRLEEAKIMVRRAEEDWKEKSRLLDNMERAIKDLAKPIQQSLVALGHTQMQVEITSVDHVHERLQEIGRGIQDAVNKHRADMLGVQEDNEMRVGELNKEYEMDKKKLYATIDELKKACQDAEEGAATVAKELGSTIVRLKEELENARTQHRASAIPVPVSTTPTAGSPAPSTSSVTLMSSLMHTGIDNPEQVQKTSMAFSVGDRVLLSALALDLGIHLPLVSSPEDANYPSSSVLLDKSEKRSKTGSTLAVSQTSHTSSSSSSVAISSSSGSGRSSSTTVPLSKDILRDFDFSDLDVAETTSLIKKKLLDTEHLLKRWQRECKHLKEKYNRAAAEAHEKIAFRNFKVDDLTLFLPTRNSVTKPWAAFNINFPHYFLDPSSTMVSQLRNREWIVARITSITEAIVDKRLEVAEENNGTTPSSLATTSTAVSFHNPFGLADGVKYYLLEATSWNGYHGHGKSSSYHSGSGRESSSKLRHHSSTSALSESSSSSSRREKERLNEGKDKDHENERRKHRERSNAHGEKDGSHITSIKEDHLIEISSSQKPRVAKEKPYKESISTSSPLSTAVKVSSTSGVNASMLSLHQSASESGHGLSDSQATVVTDKTMAGFTQQQTRTGSTTAFGAESSSSNYSPPTGQSGSAAGYRSSVGATGSSPISIPYQSAATNALRAISSSVGSTGSGSGSIPSLLAHHLAGIGSNSGSGSGPTMVASSPPRTMILSSSPHITGISTVSAMGTTVSVNSGSSTMAPSHTQDGGVPPSIGSISGSSSSSNAPVHPSRLSFSSNREDIEQLAVFATDEEQEWDREQQQQREQQQRNAFHRTSSSTSTWHGHGDL